MGSFLGFQIRLIRNWTDCIQLTVLKIFTVMRDSKDCILLFCHIVYYTDSFRLSRRNGSVSHFSSSAAVVTDVVNR